MNAACIQMKGCIHSKLATTWWFCICLLSGVSRTTLFQILSKTWFNVHRVSSHCSLRCCYAIPLWPVISCRVLKYQDDLRDMVLEKAERLENVGWEEYLKWKARGPGFQGTQLTARFWWHSFTSNFGRSNLVQSFRGDNPVQSFGEIINPSDCGLQFSC